MNPFWNKFFNKIAGVLQPGAYKLVQKAIPGAQKILSGPEYKAKMMALAKQKASAGRARQIAQQAAQKVRTPAPAQTGVSAYGKTQLLRTELGQPGAPHITKIRDLPSRS